MESISMVNTIKSNNDLTETIRFNRKNDINDNNNEGKFNMLYSK